MSITLSPSKAAYLARVAEGLSDLPLEDREEVMQDLEAHLAELEEPEVEATLGDPDEFVSEFRASAGLDTDLATARPPRLDGAREALNEASARLAEITRWQSFRPVWIWVRGWLLVSAWSLLYDFEGFERFPIPTIGGRTLTGLVLVVGATWLSFWLDRGAAAGHAIRSFGTVAFSMVTVVALIGMLLNPMPTQSAIHDVYEEPSYFDGLTGAEGEPIENIYAYDLDGDRVEVLLFDQNGRPLLSLPSHVYDDADANPGIESIDYGNGTVSFRRDQFGRVIPNLYPLDLTVYDEMGRQIPMPPPSLGFPDIEQDVGPERSDPGDVSTTIVGGR